MKKKTRTAPPPAKPGPGRQHLMNLYGEMPENNFKVGHILTLYFQHGKSETKTVTAIKRFAPDHISLNISAVKTVVNRYGRYKHLSRESEFESFALFCAEPFTLDSSPPPVQSHEAMDTCTSPVPGPSQQQPPHTPVKNTDSPRTPRHMLTPRKLEMRKRLTCLSNMRNTEKKKYLTCLRSLKEKLKYSDYHDKKKINQCKQRRKNSMLEKDKTIAQLKEELLRLKKGPDMSVEAELRHLQRTHKRLLNSNKEKLKEKKSETVSKEEFMRVKKELSEQKELTRGYENEVIQWQERVEELKNEKSQEKETKKDGKTYSVKTRMMVYDTIVGQVPTNNVPGIIAGQAKRNGDVLTSVPHRTTVEQMARELDTIADLKSAELAMKSKNLTLGFDATTQEGVHVNSIHLTTKSDCDLVAVDELPGGTANDYHGHITNTIDYLADVYSDFHEEEYQYCRETIISNIANTMNDRAAVNQATIRQVNASWGKTLNELNCHLHPLDTIATKCRSALKSVESEKGELFGNDCVIGNLVVQMNKLRYKDSKGDPKGFKTFLDDNNLPRGLLPRYRGNRLHILFHISGKFFEHYDLLLNFLGSGSVSCGGLVPSLLKDFGLETAITEMQVVGILGKLLTGPWMTKFYASAESEVSHMEGINIVKDVLCTLRQTLDDPVSIITRNVDFFGGAFKPDDKTLHSLLREPVNKDMFRIMATACLKAIIEVLERQYKRYFGMDITEQLRRETESARLHNIDSEEIMGMFSAGKERAKNANVDFLVARMRAKKNNVVGWLDSVYEGKRSRIVTWAIGKARKKRSMNRKKICDVNKELSRRAAHNRQKKNIKERKDIEKKLKNLDVSALKTVFPEVSDETHVDLVGLFEGSIVGRSICHTWYDEDTDQKTEWCGRVEKMKKRKKDGNKQNIHCYKIAYWSAEGSYEDAEDFEIPKLELAADLICEDLIFC
ncbi:uncharacterized protein LOC126820380 [Patella vulgata]|uniref:uncharacterized protein LOC126820380 n=1 Tax=Patella vulgata TaxID=6465 RepID=UPI0021805C0B|nr:uncharacterized protein LOC126820380 [Patella vulgata]